MHGQDRYIRSNHVLNGSCTNKRGTRRTVIENRFLAVVHSENPFHAQLTRIHVQFWADVC